MTTDFEDLSDQIRSIPMIRCHIWPDFYYRFVTIQQVLETTIFSLGFGDLEIIFQKKSPNTCTAFRRECLLIPAINL